MESVSEPASQGWKTPRGRTIRSGRLTVEVVAPTWWYLPTYLSIHLARQVRGGVRGGSARSPAPAATLARRTTQGDGGDGDGSDGGGCVSQERGCEAARYGRVDADDRQSGVATRAFRVRRFSPAPRALPSFEFRLRNVLGVGAGNIAATLSPVTSGIQSEDRQSSSTSRRAGRNQGRRGNIATLKAPRRNRYALPFFSLPRKIADPVDDSMINSEPVAGQTISHSAEFGLRFPATISPRQRNPHDILLRRNRILAFELSDCQCRIVLLINSDPNRSISFEYGLWTRLISARNLRGSLNLPMQSAHSSRSDRFIRENHQSLYR